MNRLPEYFITRHNMNKYIALMRAISDCVMALERYMLRYIYAAFLIREVHD